MSPITSSSSAAALAATSPKSIVIVGGGIIGVCTAYYTAISPHFQAARGDKITLVEATEVASAASGKAGGLLALDWHGQATASE
jgi:glycine/D-amino acid oxidase-like deaminating enzyme